MNLILSIIYPIFAVGIDYSIVINTNMNKVMKKLTLIIVTLVVLGSCKKTEEPAPVPEQELVPIQIATAVPRATDYAFETGDNVGLFVVNEPKNLQIRGNHVDNCKFTFDGTKWNAGKEIYWLDATTKADFYCYYPYTSSVSSITSFPFQVSQDQSTESGGCLQSAESDFGILQSHRSRSKSAKTRARRVATRHRILCGERSTGSPLLRIRWSSLSIIA